MVGVHQVVLARRSAGPQLEPGVAALLRPCAGLPPPSCAVSTLCESL